MRFSFTALLRLTMMLALGSTLVAIEVARLFPGGLDRRSLRQSNIAGFTGLNRAGADDGTRFLDPETGAVTRLLLPPGELLDDAACSPWQDERGVSHVVGRWRKDKGTGGEIVLTDIGLACFTFPGAEQVAHITCEMLPQGGACWFPGTVDRVLFASAAGVLYHVSFETGARARLQAVGDESEPVPLRWETTPPGDGVPMIRQPCWPRMAGFERTVLVALRCLAPKTSALGYTNSQLWWLRLDAQGTAIIAAGRVTPTGNAVEDQSAPSLAVTPGGLALAYVTGTIKHLNRQLHLAPIVLDPKDGAPQAEWGRSVVLADDCADTPAAFTADGRWVYTLLHPARPEARLERIAVPSELATRKLMPAAVGERDKAEAHTG